MRSLLILLLSFVFINACSSTSKSRSQSQDKYVITNEVITNSSATNAFEIIQQHRPQWFIRIPSRGTKSLYTDDASHPVVYMNDVRRGKIETLRQISSQAVKEIRYLKPREASLRFGLGHTGGAILLKMK
ncbi:MAG: hypothetical protein ACE5HS_07480 [bacterium]